MGDTWVHLRLCRICGHVGCDSSPGKRATGHFHSTRHPLMRSFQPGESWTWCYLDEKGRRLTAGGSSPRRPA